MVSFDGNVQNQITNLWDTILPKFIKPQNSVETFPRLIYCRAIKSRKHEIMWGNVNKHDGDAVRLHGLSVKNTTL